MNHLVIGLGQIGQAIQKLFVCDGRDTENLEGDYDVIHICFPYSESFIENVKKYKKQYKAKYVVIHSTVPVGTCTQIGAIHSPVTGKHPDLLESIKTFTKFFAGENAKVIANEFAIYGCKVKVLNKPENTEAGKLWALNIYGINVLLEKEIYRYCQENNLDFDDVYTEFVDMYNNGYRAMDMPEFQQYKLKHVDGKIGGHCVIQNMPHLKSKFAELLITWNEKNGIM